MPGTFPRIVPVIFAALAAACSPWRSDIDLTPGVAAAPVLAVEGWQPPIHATGPRRVAFGPWSAERHRDRDRGWSMTLRHDSTVTGSAWCRSELGPGTDRRKGRWQEIPDETLSCELALAAEPDTVRLEIKADAGRPMTGRATNEDWALIVRGTDRLRTRECLVMPTCGWYVNLDGMDIAAVETDARAWVFISSDLGDEVRSLAALVAGVLLLREDPATPRHGPMGPPPSMGHPF